MTEDIEIYTLRKNPNNHWEVNLGRPVTMYNSLTWTEKYADHGSFKLTLPYTPENRSLLPLGTNIIISKSDRICRVETVRMNSNDGGTLVVEGRTLEFILDYRNSVRNYTLNGVIQERARTEAVTRAQYPTFLIHAIAANMFKEGGSGAGFTYDQFTSFRIPYKKTGHSGIFNRLNRQVLSANRSEIVSYYDSFFKPEDYVSGTWVRYEFEANQTLLDWFKEISSAMGCGFCFRHDYLKYWRGRLSGETISIDKLITFPEVLGSDRTTRHNRLGAPIEFKVSNGVLLASEKVESNVDVIHGVLSTTSQNEDEVPHHSPPITNVLNPDHMSNPLEIKYGYSHHPHAEDQIEVTRAELISEQRKILNSHKTSVLLSSEVNIRNPDAPVYNTDYAMGDIVLVEDIEGLKHRARVVEYTFVYSPEDGYNEIPTFDYIDLEN